MSIDDKIRLRNLIRFEYYDSTDSTLAKIIDMLNADICAPGPYKPSSAVNNGVAEFRSEFYLSNAEYLSVDESMRDVFITDCLERYLAKCLIDYNSTGHWQNGELDTDILHISRKHSSHTDCVVYRLTCLFITEKRLHELLAIEKAYGSLKCVPASVETVHAAMNEVAQSLDILAKHLHTKDWSLVQQLDRVEAMLKAVPEEATEPQQNVPQPIDAAASTAGLTLVTNVLQQAIAADALSAFVEEEKAKPQEANNDTTQ